MGTPPPNNFSVCCFPFAVKLIVYGHAFTIDKQSRTNPDGSTKFVDPDESIENFATGRGTLQASCRFRKSYPHISSGQGR